MSSPTWRHDDHPGWYVVGGSPLRRQHFVVDDLPEEVLVDLWVDPDVVLGSPSMDGASLYRLLDAEWDYSALHPSRLISALVELEADSPALRRLSGLDESLPLAADDVLRALWEGATARAATALGLACRRDTPADLLGAIVDWCASMAEPGPEVRDAIYDACQGAPIETVRSAARAGCVQACAVLVGRPEPLADDDALVCSQVLAGSQSDTGAGEYQDVLVVRYAMTGLAKRKDSL